MIISFSGPDGSGKSTACAKTAARLTNLGYGCEAVYLGDYFILSTAIRMLHLLHGFFKKKPTPGKSNPFLGTDPKPLWTRLWLILSLIDSWLFFVYLRAISLNGKIVLCDRYFYDRLAGFVYHGYAGRIASYIYLKLTPKPDEAFFFRASPEIARIRETGNRHPLSFFTSMSKIYENISRQLPVVNIDNDKPGGKINSAIFTRVVKRIKSGHNFRTVGYVFAVVFLLSFFPIFFNTSYIGTTWDWGYPAYPSQAWERLERGFYAWHGKISLGSPNSYIASSIPVSAVIYLLSHLPGYWGQRAFILIIFLTAYIGAIKLSSYLKFSRLISLSTALVYTFSAVTYTRLVAGHMEILVGYSLLPLIIYHFLRALDKHSIVNIILSALVFNLASAHFVNIFNIGVILGVFVLVNYRKFWLRGYLLFAFVYLLTNYYWIYPFLAGLFNNSVSFKDNLVAADLTLSRWEIFMRSSLNLWDPVGLTAPLGMNTEFVYPMPAVINFMRYLVYGILGAAGIRFFRSRNNIYPAFIWSYIISLILVMGAKTPAGIMIYRIIQKAVPEIFFLFTNSNRFNLALHFAAVFSFGISFKFFTSRMNKLKFGLLFIYIIISIFPFISGQITRPVLTGTQPMALSFREFTKSEKELISDIGKIPVDTRVSFIPSGQYAFIPQSQYSFPWLYHLYPRDEFYSHNSIGGDFGKFVYGSVYRDRNYKKFLTDISSRTAVKKLCTYPKDHYVYSSVGYIPPKYYGNESLFYPDQKIITELVKDQDMEAGKIYADRLHCWDNPGVKSRITVSGNILYSTGDFGDFMRLKDTPFSGWPVVYLSQFTGNLDNWPAETILFMPGSETGLILPFIPGRFIIFSGRVVSGYFDKWYQGSQKWDLSKSRINSLEKNMWAQAETPSVFSVKLSGTEGKSRILFEILSDPAAGDVEVYLDGKLNRRMSLQNQADLGFTWQEIKLDSPVSRISFDSKTGINSVGRIIYVPEKDYLAALGKAKGLFSRSGSILFLDFTENATQSGITGRQPAVSGDNREYEFDLPEVKTYDLYLKPKDRTVKISGISVITVNGRQVDIQNETAMPEGKPAVTNIKFSSGKNLVGIGKNINKYLDGIYFISDRKKASENRTGPDVIKKSPAGYEIRNAGGSYLLFAENYNTKWSLYHDNEVIKPVKANGFANLYLIKGIKTGNMRLIYDDQKFLDTGLIVSISALSISLITVIYSGYRNKRTGMSIPGGGYDDKLAADDRNVRQEE